MTSGDRFAGIDLSTEEGNFTTQQVQVVADLQEAIQSRDQEISKLGAIFKELAVLVNDQGTILNHPVFDALILF